MRDTKIQWCDSTINCSSGCDGCELWAGDVRTCYAGTLQETRLSRSLPALYSAKFEDVQMIPGRFAQAASWSDLRGVVRPDKPWLNGMPRCIFVGDMGDFLSKGVTDEFLKEEMLGAITSKQGQRHFWMLLTKRPWRLAALSKMWGGLPDNVMAMTTITDQRTARIRLSDLLKVNCRWKGISAEPLLSPVELDPYLEFIDWVICGGESGDKDPRPMHPDWARGLRDQCEAAQVPFLFKQWGALLPRDHAIKSTPATSPDAASFADMEMFRVGKGAAGRLLDGREWNGMPKIEGRAA